MKTTGRVCNKRWVALTLVFLATAPLAAHGELKVDRTTIGGTNAVNLCVRGYGATVAEALETGAKLVEKADAQLGEDKLFGDVRLQVLPEKENGLFVVVAYSFATKEYCAVRLDYKTADLNR